MSISGQLGEQRELELPQGPISYRERGQGRPVVFVHGYAVNGDLWRKVVPGLAERGFRCITPDWPLGSHTRPMHKDADLSLPGVALIVAEFLNVLGLRDVVLVGNDSGGAVSQLVAARHPERLGALVLTPCDAFENCPPKGFGYLKLAVRIPGAGAVLANSLRIRPLMRLPIAFGRLSSKGFGAEVDRSYMGPQQSSRAIRHDAKKFVLGMDPRHTLAAAEEIRSFGKPVLLAWTAKDSVFPLDHARRLATLFPDARVETIADSKDFVSEDQPDALVALIAEFARAPQREDAAV